MDLYMMPLEEIKKIKDRQIRKEFLEEYRSFFLSLFENAILKKEIMGYYGLSMEEVFEKFERVKETYLSNTFFPDDFILFYPYYREIKSESFFYDDLGHGVNKKSLYVLYRPLIVNETRKTKYVLNPSLKVEIGSRDILPETLSDFEALHENILHTEEEPFCTLHHKYDRGLTLKKLK